MLIFDDNGIDGSIDIMKLAMAFLVVSIHTEPFGFNFWLDKSFGLVTRLCVPFFFVASGYFYWLHKKDGWYYFNRISLLYFAWTIIYLPFDLYSGKFSKMSFSELAYKFFWIGNDHALWYLCGSIVGFLIINFLLKIFSTRAVFAISIIFLVIGCMRSTYAPICTKLFSNSWGGVRLETDCITLFPICH